MRSCSGHAKIEFRLDNETRKSLSEPDVEKKFCQPKVSYRTCYCHMIIKLLHSDKARGRFIYCFTEKSFFMRFPLRVLLIFCCVAVKWTAYAQQPFKAIDSIDVGNINAAIDCHGYLWQDKVFNSVFPHCEFPKGSRKNIAFSGSLWFGGYDSQLQLHMSAQSYMGNDVDYWPGPLDSSQNNFPPISYTHSKDWAKVWKINRWETEAHLSHTTHTILNTPASVLEWPGYGNPYAKGNNGAALVFYGPGAFLYAPFVDLNSNGTYEPLLGEYPQFEGDQATWNVFNDYGPTHSTTNGASNYLIVQCMSYAYHRNTAVDNIVFYKYKIIHYNNTPIDSFVTGLFLDLDVGYSYDDYIGFDSSRNLAYAYNADGLDELSYDDSIPMVGVTVLKSNNWDTCGVNLALGTAIYFHNNSDPIRGKPVTAAQHYNYLTGSWRNGSWLAAPYADGSVIFNDGTGLGARVPYVFDGKTYNGTAWTECAVNNPPTDKRFVLGLQPQTISPGLIDEFAFALVVSPMEKNNGCPSYNLAALQAIADTARKVFCDPLPISTATKDVNQQRNGLQVFPNPASNTITVKTGDMVNARLEIYDALGRKINVPVTQNGSSTTLDISLIPVGIYHLIIQDQQSRRTVDFLKN